MVETRQQTPENQRRRKRKVAVILMIFFTAVLLIIGASLRVFFLVGVAVFLFVAAIFIYMVATRYECGAVNQNANGNVSYTAQGWNSAAQSYSPPPVAYQQTVTTTSYGYPQKLADAAHLTTNSPGMGPYTPPQAEFVSMPHSQYVASGMALSPQQQSRNITTTSMYEHSQVTPSPMPQSAYPTDDPPSYAAAFNHL